MNRKWLIFPTLIVLALITILALTACNSDRGVAQSQDQDQCATFQGQQELGDLYPGKTREELEATLICNYCNLRGIDLSGANLDSANLAGSDLGGADLSGANLTGATLIAARFDQADLTEANLSWAILSHVSFRESDLSGVNLQEAYISDAVLTNANLTGADISEGTTFAFSLLDGANFEGVTYDDTTEFLENEGTPINVED